jgi:hypothetical protein
VDRCPAAVVGHRESEDGDRYLRIHWPPCRAFTAAVRSFKFFVS